MLSVLSDASFILTWILGPIQVLCILGVFVLRHRPVFAIRIPELMLGLMIFKFFGFALCAWMLLDGSCPCIVFTFAHLCDNVGNYYSALRRLVLLLRFELQAALDHVKQGANAAALDEKNIFVRYRFLLRAKWQYMLMAAMFVALAVPKMVLVLALLDQTEQPCVTLRMDASPFVFWNMILVLFEFWPVTIMSGWLTHKLKAFPDDNWKMESEWTYNSVMATCQFIAMLFTLGFQPFLDKFVFLLFTFSVFHQLCSFFIPLKFHHNRVKQFAKLDLNKTSSLVRLLQDSTFVEAFHAFLTKEFSSENLYFWLEAHRIQYKYKELLPNEMAEVTSSSNSGSAGTPIVREHPKKEEVNAKLIAAAANECVYLGQQCIGDHAPWQINISGGVGSGMAGAIGQLSEFFKVDVTDEQIHNELTPLVEDALRWMMKAQYEIYECLRKDPYPRFVQSRAFAELNDNARFKMGLATEIIEEEARGTTRSSSTTRKSEPKPIQMVEKKRSSFMTGSVPWSKPLTQVLNVARKEALEHTPASQHSIGASDDEPDAMSSRSNMSRLDIMIEPMRTSSSNPLEELTITPIFPPSPTNSSVVSSQPEPGSQQSDAPSSSMHPLDEAI